MILPKPIIHDHLGRVVKIDAPVVSIVSLVPSISELLVDLGLSEALKGVTRFCIHPNQVRKEKINVGGTKNPNLAVIESISPSIIIANKEENRLEDVEKLAANFPVYVTDVSTLEDNLRLIKDLGSIFNKVEEAKTLILQQKALFGNPMPLKGLKVAYLIWQEPFMTIGSDTFIHSMIEFLGFENAYKNSTRYPIIELEELADESINVIFLSSEPYPFSAKHVEKLKACLPGKRIELVDGEAFSWYGTRILKKHEYLLGLANNLSTR